MIDSVLSLFTFKNAITSIAFAASFYTAAGAICRMRHSRHHIKREWSAIYFLMFCLAVWAILKTLTDGIDTWGSTVCVAIAIYIHLTKSSWANGVPPIAQPNYVPPPRQNRRQSDLKGAS